MTPEGSGGTSGAVTGTTRLAGVIGDPVRHSLSPILHNAAYAALGLDWVYVALPVLAGGGPAAVASMRTLGIEGLSVTMPHKHAVLDAVDDLTPTARRLGMVNSIFRRGDELVGDNNDGAGLVECLRRDLGVDLDGRRCAVIGAGGAARAIIDALAGAGVDSVVVIGRTPGRVAEAVAFAGGIGKAGTESDVADCDVVANATPIGMSGGPAGSPVAASALRPGQIVVDTIYSPLRTPLMAAAEQAGATAVNGVGMLVRLSELVFARFTGVPAPDGVMAHAAAAELRRRGAEAAPSA